MGIESEAFCDSASHTCFSGRLKRASLCHSKRLDAPLIIFIKVDSFEVVLTRVVATK